MASAKKWRRHNATNGMYCSRQRRGSPERPDEPGHCCGRAPRSCATARRRPADHRAAIPLHDQPESRIDLRFLGSLLRRASFQTSRPPRSAAARAIPFEVRLRRLWRRKVQHRLLELLHGTHTSDAVIAVNVMPDRESVGLRQVENLLNREAVEPRSERDTTWKFRKRPLLRFVTVSRAQAQTARTTRWRSCSSTAMVSRNRRCRSSRESKYDP
jgi:hypothetical protein